VVLSVERLGGIRVRDDSEGSSLIDFIEKFLSGHSKFLIYVHGYVSNSHSTLEKWALFYPTGRFDGNLSQCHNQCHD